jgi:hypothetical protein
VHSRSHRGAQVKPVTFTVEASGDLLIHSPVWEAALADGGGTHYDFAALLAQIKPIIKSIDLPLCHVETPMSGQDILREPEWLSSRESYEHYLRYAWPGSVVLLDTDAPEPQLLELRAHLNPLIGTA